MQKSVKPTITSEYTRKQNVTEDSSTKDFNLSTSPKRASNSSEVPHEKVVSSFEQIAVDNY